MENSLLFNFDEIWPETMYFLNNIRTSICIRKCNKIWGCFQNHFSEKSMNYIAHAFFRKMAPKTSPNFITFSDTY